MGRRTARLVPTADSTVSSSSSSAVVFTPVVPADDVADSGPTSSARYREYGREYDSHLPSSGAALYREKWDASFCVQDGGGSRGQYSAWNRGAGSGATEQACGGESRRILGYFMLHVL